MSDATQMPFDPRTVIAAKRDGAILDADHVAGFVRGFTSGAVSDAQVAAFAMAVACRGMDAAETAALCEAMVASGVQLSWDVDVPVLDKHSTGGVGDKVSIVLAPLLASAGVAVPMLSGRALAHTGGTLDKLESIPGFRCSLDVAELRSQLSSVGCFIAATTPDLVPADAVLYGLRDHTATVPSIPLIASSIMSKKIAAGTDALVVDVKFGSGAFCSTFESAAELADALSALADVVGLRFDAAITPMSQPLGRTVGNACEIREALDVLEGSGPLDVVELSVMLAVRLCELVDSPVSAERFYELLASGAAFETFEAMVTAQGGSLGMFTDRAPATVPVHAPGDGFVSVDALGAALAAVDAGASRSRPGAPVDHLAGVVLAVGPDDRVERGDVVAHVTSSVPACAAAGADRLAAAVSCSPTRPPVTAPVWISGARS